MMIERCGVKEAGGQTYLKVKERKQVLAIVNGVKKMSRL